MTQAGIGMKYPGDTVQTAAAVATTKGATGGASKGCCAPAAAGAGPREGLGYKSGACVRACACAWVCVGCLIKGGRGPKRRRGGRGLLCSVFTLGNTNH